MSAAKPANDADRADDATFLRSTRLDPRYRSTRYPDTAAPPSSDGADHDTDTLPAAPVALTLRGADGLFFCGGIVRVLPTASAPAPALLRAEMRNS
ncbi:MAG: hypothetical protein OXT07_10510 [bacterium]|nr:hypothetical protein [bacterium]